MSFMVPHNREVASVVHVVRDVRAKPRVIQGGGACTELVSCSARWRMGETSQQDLRPATEEGTRMLTRPLLRRNGCGMPLYRVNGLTDIRFGHCGAGHSSRRSATTSARVCQSAGGRNPNKGATHLKRRFGASAATQVNRTAAQEVLR